MNALLQVMGLQPGQEGMAKLTKLMKQGKIPVEKLFEFLDLIAKRAKETGAYDLAINSKTATENRMTTSYRTFAEAFGRMFDEEIKAPFKGFEKFFDKITAWIDEQEKIKKETGEIGKFETSVSLVTTLFGDLADSISMIIEGWGGLLDLLPGGSMISQHLAQKQLSDAYYESKGAKTYAEKQALYNAGSPGFDAFRREQFYAVDPFNTEAEYEKFVSNTQGKDIYGLVTGKLTGLFESLIQSTKDNAQAVLDAKYNNPMPPPVININGVTDPMAIKGVVDDSLKDIFRVPR